MNPFACVSLPFTKQLDLDTLPFLYFLLFTSTCLIFHFLFLFFSFLVSSYLFIPFYFIYLLSDFFVSPLLFPLLFLLILPFLLSFPLSSLVFFHLFDSHPLSSPLLSFPHLSSLLLSPTLLPVSLHLLSCFFSSYLFCASTSFLLSSLLFAPVRLPSSLHFSLPPSLPLPSLSCPVMSINWAPVITVDSEISSFFIESVNDMWHSQ